MEFYIYSIPFFSNKHILGHVYFYEINLRNLLYVISIPASSRTLQAARQLREEIKKTPANTYTHHLQGFLFLSLFA